jgi:general secretion pathway protein C
MLLVPRIRRSNPSLARPSRMGGKLALRMVTLLLWLAAAGSVVYWLLQFVRPAPAPAQASVLEGARGTVAVETAAVAKALGGGRVEVAAGASNAPTAAPSIDVSRFQLTGVVAGRAPLALIAVDGKPARPLRQGAAVADGIVLQRVAKSSVTLATSPDANDGITLDLPVVTSAIVGNVIPVRPPIPIATAAPPPPPIMVPQVGVTGPALSLPPGSVQTPAAAAQNAGRSSASQMRADRAERERARGRGEPEQSQ